MREVGAGDGGAGRTSRVGPGEWILRVWSTFQHYHPLSYLQVYEVKEAGHVRQNFLETVRPSCVEHVRTATPVRVPIASHPRLVGPECRRTPGRVP